MSCLINESNTTEEGREHTCDARVPHASSSGAKVGDKREREREGSDERKKRKRGVHRLRLASVREEYSVQRI